jgi:hypothetical protein
MPTYRVNDVTIECEPCDHCGAQASEGDALAAIVRHHEIMGRTTCSACGEEIVSVSWEVQHLVLEGKPVWYAAPTDRGAAITVLSARRRIGMGGTLHEACARRALPHLSPEVWKELAEDRSRAMWPTPGV